MDSSKTYELQIQFPKNSSSSLSKESVVAWLKDHGVNTFVEGAVDALNLDHEYGEKERDFYTEEGGEFSPISIYSFDQGYLQELAKQLTDDHPSISLKHLIMDSQSWQVGWKESFKPISTDLFYIYPPWEKASHLPAKCSIVIDPGMAFGTGQHATTQLCLRFIETLQSQSFDFSHKKMMDVGTGSGILAIALAKLAGPNPQLWSTDIDKDAIIACKENAKANQVTFSIEATTITQQGPKDFDLIVANILHVVLERIVPDLAQVLAPSGKIILSGLLEEDAEQMISTGQKHGLKFLASLTHEGWIALLMEKS